MRPTIVIFLSLLVVQMISGCGRHSPPSNVLASVPGVPNYSIKFVLADIGPNGLPKKETINGVSRLVFRELSEDDEQKYAKPIQRVKDSLVIRKGLELRSLARDYKSILSNGRLSVEDGPADPFYIVLRWNVNTLEAKADQSIVYSRDGSVKFSSVSLIVTGLGPVPFDKLTGIPFISDTIINHELMHCMQIESTGSDEFIANAMRSSSINALAHKINLQTDPTLAFIEGFAESFERIGGSLVNVNFKKIYDDFVANGPGELSSEQFEFVRDKIMSEELRRQTWIRSGYFGGFDDLHLDSALFHYPRDILNSEGVVANALYNFLSSPEIPSVFPKLVTTLIKRRPATLVDFFEGFAAEFPGDRALSNAMYIRQTLGVTRNASTFPLFKTWRLEQSSGPDTPAAKLAKQRFEDTIDVEVEVAEYEPILNSLFNKPLKINTKDLGKHYPPFSVDLNQDSEQVLLMVFEDLVAHYEKIGLSAAVKGFKGKEKTQVDAIIARREALYNLTSLAELEGFVHIDLIKILRANAMR